jgi:hypothetical protein
VASGGSFSPEKKATKRTQQLYSNAATEQQQQQYSDRSMAPTEPQKPPLAYATFVTQRPWLALLLLLLLPLILSAIAMPNFTLNDLEGWDVRAGTSSKNNDAWNLAEEQTFPFKDTSASEKTSTDSSSTAVEQPRTVDSGLSLTVYYQDLSDQHNMLRPKGLAFMGLRADFRKLEEKMEFMPEEAKISADREMKRLKRIPPSSMEHSMLLSWLEWMVDLPWGVNTEDRIDVEQCITRITEGS